MILADTSAWVEFDRATASAVDTRLTELIATTTDDVAVSEPIIMEVLARARDDRRERDLRRLMDRFTLLRFDAQVDFHGATRIYRTSLLTSDSDLVYVARVMGIELDVT